VTAVCRSRRDFRRLRGDGRTIRRRALWIRVVTDASMSECRVAFAIGRRLGNAVTRNRLRRRLRASLGRRRMQLPSGLLLVGANPSAVGSSFAALDAELGDLLAAAADSPAPAGRRAVPEAAR
jgi:ribonuclease P protein component